MKKIKLLAATIIASLVVTPTFMYADVYSAKEATTKLEITPADKLSPKISSTPIDRMLPVGYWVQFDEDNDSGKGLVQGIIKSEYAKNDEHGKKGTLQMEIVVPILAVKDGKVSTPDIHCNICGSGDVDGFVYNYKDPKTNYFQGLAIAGNLTPEERTGNAYAGVEYGGGGVLNPNDGKTYHAKAQVQDDGKTLFVRAYIGTGWYAVGKDAHWKRITKEQYLAVKKQCGINKETELYPYQNKDGSINDAAHKSCYTYDFGVDNPAK